MDRSSLREEVGNAMTLQCQLRSQNVTLELMVRAVVLHRVPRLRVGRQQSKKSGIFIDHLSTLTYFEPSATVSSRASTVKKSVNTALCFT
ncbi:hypothetical protein E4T56_gene14775 [Termitomyces sp. T112]|nr:hypothetical protein E4T56_gene14775 [Termitomyces sp. T112]